MVYGDGECRTVVVRVFANHLPQSESGSHIGTHRHAYQTFGVCGHEVYVGFVRIAGRAYQVAFVFPAGIIDDYYHLSIFQVCDRFFYTVEFHNIFSSLLQSGRQHRALPP